MATLVAVLAVHATVLMGVFRQQSRNLPREVAAEVLATAEIIGTDGELDKVPAPDLQLENVPVDVEGLQDIDFDDSIRDELAGVIASVSAPHLARAQRVEPATFARRAQLPPGVALDREITWCPRCYRDQRAERGSGDSIHTARRQLNPVARPPAAPPTIGGP